MRRAGLMLLVLLLAATPLAAADLSGNWTIDGDVQGNPVPLTCAIQQGADAKITGKCQIQGMDTELEGTAKDDGFTFSFSISGYTLTYTGKLDGDSVSGSIEVAGATGTFSGKRTK